MDATRIGQEADLDAPLFYLQAFSCCTIKALPELKFHF